MHKYPTLTTTTPQVPCLTTAIESVCGDSTDAATCACTSQSDIANAAVSCLLSSCDTDELLQAQSAGLAQCVSSSTTTGGGTATGTGFPNTTTTTGNPLATGAGTNTTTTTGAPSLTTTSSSSSSTGTETSTTTGTRTSTSASGTAASASPSAGAAAVQGPTVVGAGLLGLLLAGVAAL